MSPEKRILLLIDSLGSGGAERQISYLAILLRKNGYDVKLVVFTSQNKFYEEFLLDNGVVPEYNLPGINKFRRIWEIAKIVRRFKPDLVVAYKGGICMSAVLSQVFASCNLAVSERHTTLKLNRYEKIKFFLYRFARHIVPNSESQAQFIRRNYPGLAGKVKVIRNTIDMDLFCCTSKSDNSVFKIVTTATLYETKNALALVEAASILKSKGVKCRFEWYGKKRAGDSYPQKVERLISERGLDDYFFVYPASKNVVDVYRSADLFCLPSLKEGFPNVICEAMACELPIACSNVCDNPYIVEEGVNGLLFDPNNPGDMADKIGRIIAMPVEERESMGRKNRKKIVELCSPQKFMDNYISLI